MLEDVIVAIQDLQLTAAGNPAAHLRSSIRAAAIYLTFCSPHACPYMGHDGAHAPDNSSFTRSWSIKEAISIQHAAADVLSSLLVSSPLLPARVHVLEYAAEFLAHINVMSACPGCSCRLWGRASIVPAAVHHILRLALPLQSPAHPVPSTASMPMKTLQFVFSPLLRLCIVEAPLDEALKRFESKLLANLHALAKVLCTWFFVSEWLPMWSALRPMFDALLEDVLLPHVRFSPPKHAPVLPSTTEATQDKGTSSDQLCGRKRQRHAGVMLEERGGEDPSEKPILPLKHEMNAPLWAVTAALARACHDSCSPSPVDCVTCALSSCVPSSLPSSTGFYAHLVRNVAATCGASRRQPSFTSAYTPPTPPSPPGVIRIKEEAPALNSHVLHRVFEYLKPKVPSRPDAPCTILQCVQTYQPLMRVSSAWRDAVTCWAWWDTMARHARVIPSATDMSSVHVSRSHMTVFCECGGCARVGASHPVLTRLASQLARANRLSRAAAARMSQLCGRPGRGGVAKPRLCAFCGCDAVFGDTASLKHHIHAAHGVRIRQAPSYCKLCW